MTNYARSSYNQNDCIFLLKEIEMQFTNIEEKERQIQLGIAHYSETISKESPPSEKYVKLFLELTEMYKFRLAKEVVRLSKIIEDKIKDDVCIVSLARAGSPIGVLVNRAFNKYSCFSSCHYSVSIIRDKGLDFNALDHLINDQGIRPESIVFIDGWTAKGVITRELKKSVSEYNLSRNVNVSDALFVVSDIGSTADYSATKEDYTIPSALMNSTVSGLVSRSILNDHIKEHDFHGCVSYDYLEPYDNSNWFIGEVYSCFDSKDFIATPNEENNISSTEFNDYIKNVMEEFKVTNINRIKPGIAEATRVMLRRVPDILIVRDIHDINVSHLLQLANEKFIQTVVKSDMPMGACALIQDVINNEKRGSF
ncbi:cysteine protease StiP family protein [Vibrio sp. PNB22_4_1]